MMTSEAVSEGERVPVLARRLSVLCHVIRFVAAAWALWVLVVVLRIWTDKQTVTGHYGRYLRLDLAALPDAHYAAGVALIMLDWMFVALVVVCVWRLFGHYVNGRIFTPEAARALRQLGIAGVAAVLADVIVRPAVMTVLSMHLAGGGRSFVPWVEPNDLLHVMMALFVVSLGHVLRTGVEIADEHRQIV